MAGIPWHTDFDAAQALAAAAGKPIFQDFWFDG